MSEEEELPRDVRVGRPGVVWAVVLVCVIAVPVFGLVAVSLFVPDSLTSDAGEPVPITMPVTAQTDTGAVGVQASLEWRSGPTLLAPAWTGLVTHIDVKVGGNVSSGTKVLDVDGRPCVALASAAPFHRSLSVGMSGTDVTMLRTALAGLKIAPTGTGDRFDTALKRAVRIFQEKFLGLRPGAADGVFDPAGVLYLPVSGLRVAKINVVVGAPVPSAGQGVVDSAAVLRPFQLGPLTNSSGVSTPLPATSSGYTLTVSEVTIPVGDGFSVSDASDLAKLAVALPDQPTSLTGQMQLSKAATFSVVPATAIVTDPDGHFCVFQASGDGKFTSVTVTPAGGLPGETEVTGLPAAVTSVVANPADLGLRGCAAG